MKIKLNNRGSYAFGGAKPYGFHLQAPEDDCLVQEIVVIHLRCRLLPTFARIFEIANQLLLFAIAANHQRPGTDESSSHPLDVAKLQISLRMLCRRDALAIRLERVILLVE
jgi:hypothetical protein